MCENLSTSNFKSLEIKQRISKLDSMQLKKILRQQKKHSTNWLNKNKIEENL